jgi:hypothetical protein
MPEHDTYDLDAAFRDLEHDIGDRSRPAGAAAAISTARRRRLTAIGGIAAGLALVVGGVVATQGLATRDSTIGPTGRPSVAPLDATHLTEATSGWVPAWTGRTEQAKRWIQQTFGGPCTWHTRGERSAITFLGNPQGDVALIAVSAGRPPTGPAHNAWPVLARDLDRCSGASLMTSSTEGAARVRVYRVTDDQQATSYTWIVSTGHGVGLLTVMKVDSPPSPATQHDVGQAVLAAVRDPASYDEPGQP